MYTTTLYEFVPLKNVFIEIEKSQNAKRDNFILIEKVKRRKKKCPEHQQQQKESANEKEK